MTNKQEAWSMVAQAMATKLTLTGDAWWVYQLYRNHGLTPPPLVVREATGEDEYDINAEVERLREGGGV